MSKDKDKIKLKGKRRRKSDNTSTAAAVVQNQQRPKIRNNNSQLSYDDGIGKSKQLAQKMKTNPSYGRPKTRVNKNNNNNNNELRICGNGKPMPSLADLEKMFDDSDDDAAEPKVNNSTISSPIIPSSCSTPRKTPVISEDKLKSPSTIKKIADKMLDFISNLPDATVLLDDAPPPRVIPPKKRKKTETPYIVGCKDRPKVIKKPNANFCKGDKDYGPKDEHNSDEDECPKKRAKRSKVANISKSIFNAKSDEIAARLMECDGALSDGSSDSNKTVAYEYYTPNTSSNLRSFSPLPSTSKDSETIHKNDIRFNESLLAEQLPSEEKENDLEIINQPLDTIILEDVVVPKKSSTVTDTSLIVLDDNSPPCSPNDVKVSPGLQNVDDDTCIEIIENKPSKIDDSPIIVEDYYSSLDLSQTYNNDVTEIIDVDDVIAESNALIEKYRSMNSLNTVTLVEPQANNTQTPSIDAESNTNVGSVEFGVEVPPSPTYEQSPSPTMTSSLFQNPAPENQVVNVPSLSPVQFVSSTPGPEPGPNISGVEYISTIPGSTYDQPNIPQNSTSPDRPRHNTIPVPHVPNPPTLPQNENDIDNVVRNFFRQNSSDGQSETILLQCGEQSSGCNHNHQRNTMCILSFLESMRDLAKNFNGGNNKKKKRNTRNTLPPQVVQSPPQVVQPLPPSLQTNTHQNVPPQTSKGLGDCPICMESLTTNPVASTICGHIFCMKCISAAVRVSGKRCPTCRKVLKGVGFHQLFL